MGTTLVRPLEPGHLVGTRIAGYKLEDVLGRGGMGVVYRARHLHLDRTVALKLLNPELAGGHAFRERFLRESRTAAALHHPNIVTVFDAGDADGLLFIAMQLIHGTDLAELLENAALDLKRALAVAADVAGALDAAHAKGLVHRDVKPGNVLMDDRHCYLTDFGLTRAVSSQTALTSHGEFVGTVDYMSPEQIEGHPVDARSDVYALGCLLYHMLAGAVPYARDSQISVVYAHMEEAPPPISAARPDLPRSLDGVLARAMAKRPDERYPTAGELVQAMHAALGGSALRQEQRLGHATAASVAVLLVTDEPSVAAMARLALRTGPFRVIDAGRAAAVEQLARSESLALALVDGDARGASDAHQALRTPRKDGRAVTVALASRGSPDAHADDADAVVLKPFSALQLQHVIAQLISLEAVAAR